MSHKLRASPARLTTYARRYFDLAPTWFTWNRLTAADIHALRSDPGFEGQNVYFYLNHPIRFVRVVGVVVEMECFAAGRYTLIQLDDGSGECIAIKITRLEKNIRHNDDTDKQVNVKTTERFGVVQEDDRFWNATAVEHVSVYVHHGLPTVYFRNARIEIGTVLRAKGTLSMFREVKQIELKMLAIVKDTTEECSSWADTARWKQTTLKSPWYLSQTEMDMSDQRQREESQAMMEKMRQKREKRDCMREKRRRYDIARESKRRQQEIEMNAGALPGTEMIRSPSD